jgi:DNA-binding transcriptional MerR regulator/effector-binding domain-containing protein
MRSALSIGDFSRITHLSVKTLRHYHEAGLLQPDQVDPQSGYRYYATTQIPTAQVIRRLRDLGMPVREVAEVLATTDLDARSALITAHLHRLENDLAHTREAVASLRRLLQPTTEEIEVELRDDPARDVAAICAAVDQRDVLVWYGDAMTELDAVLASAHQTPTGPSGGLYDNKLFTEDHGDVVVYLPATAPPTVGRVRPFSIPRAELAVTVHHGSHDDCDVTYGALGSYVTEHALAISGPVRETYLVGPLDTDDSTAWRTEIGWPIFRTASAQRGRAS